MYQLDFEEFLWVIGDTTTIPFLKMCFDEKKPLGQALHRKVMNNLRQYILVGGMSQAINKYIATKDFANVDEIKRDILTLYRNDISKFAKGYENKVISIFDEIPSQLSKKEKKYNLSSISKKVRYREYKDSVIVNPCYNSTDTNIELSFNIDLNFFSY